MLNTQCPMGSAPVSLHPPFEAWKCWRALTIQFNNLDGSQMPQVVPALPLRDAHESIQCSLTFELG